MGVLAVLFWTFLAGILLWNAPVAPWVEILKLAGLMIGLGGALRRSINDDGLTAHLTWDEVRRSQKAEGDPQPRQKAIPI